MWYDVIYDIITSDVFCTVIGGVSVFIASQLCLELWIKPRVEYRKNISKILYTLNYYADVISNPMVIHRSNHIHEFEIFRASKHSQAAEELRKLGCEIVTFDFKKKRNRHISEELIYLSNSMWSYEDLVPLKDDRASHHLLDLIDFISNSNNKNKKKKKT